jgi:hypothetical protein
MDALERFLKKNRGGIRIRVALIIASLGIVGGGIGWIIEKQLKSANMDYLRQ